MKIKLERIEEEGKIIETLKDELEKEIGVVQKDKNKRLED